MNAAQTVLLPHRTAAVFQHHSGISVLAFQHLTQPVTQLTRQLAVESGRVGVDIHFPAGAAAVGALVCNAVKFVIDVPGDFLQKCSLLFTPPPLVVESSTGGLIGFFDFNK